METYIVLIAGKKVVRGDIKEEMEIENIKIKKAFFNGNCVEVEAILLDLLPISPM